MIIRYRLTQVKTGKKHLGQQNQGEYDAAAPGGARNVRASLLND